MAFMPLWRNGCRARSRSPARPVIWNGLIVLLVIVRDPEGHEDDDHFFTTDLMACALKIPDHYGGRWSIELTFREVKPYLGGQ